VILAGGLGTRLSEETTVRPKPMVEIGGRPILWHSFGDVGAGCPKAHTAGRFVSNRPEPRARRPSSRRRIPPPTPCGGGAGGGPPVAATPSEGDAAAIARGGTHANELASANH
jgi:hypothetical protein